MNFSVRFDVSIESISKQPKEPKQTDQFRNKSKKTHKTRVFSGKNLFKLDTELLYFRFLVIFSAILWPSCKDFYMLPLFRFVSVRFFSGAV
jgi:hypothetical protein